MKRKAQEANVLAYFTPQQIDYIMDCAQEAKEEDWYSEVYVSEVSDIQDIGIEFTFSEDWEGDAKGVWQGQIYYNTYLGGEDTLGVSGSSVEAGDPITCVYKLIQLCKTAGVE